MKEPHPDDSVLRSLAQRLAALGVELSNANLHVAGEDPRDYDRAFAAATVAARAMMQAAPFLHPDFWSEDLEEPWTRGDRPPEGLN